VIQPGLVGLRHAHISFVLLLVAGAAGAELPPSLDDRTFWQLIDTLSEPEGRFPPQYMSNEDSLQFVMPELVERAPAGGVYIGVGSEQNFTYLAALDTSLAFIVDIRRDNLRQVLLYKALFEISRDRADFVGRLFSRRPRVPADANASAGQLFESFAGQMPDADMFATTRDAVLADLMQTHGFPLDAADRDGIVGILEAFRDTSPDSLKGFGDLTNPSFAELMAATDLDGKAWGFLATEANYGAVRRMHERNLIVPLVGDFAGDTAIAGIGRFLDEQAAVVSVFYLSNVERYLWEQGEHGLGFYDNVALLPRTDASLFVRSVTGDISIRLEIPIPDQPAKWRTFVTPIDPDLDGVSSGAIASYRDLFIR